MLDQAALYSGKLSVTMMAPPNSLDEVHATLCFNAYCALIVNFCHSDTNASHLA